MNQYRSLLTESLIRTNHVENAAAISLKDFSVQATTAGFKILPQQAHALVAAFKNPMLLREEGISFQDRQYTCVRADEQSMYAKNNDRGLVIVKTQLLLIVATYCEGMYPSVCVEAVEHVGDYLREKGK
ncbi:profilin-4 [Latimeria chalumnae]|uniref:Profilin n=1 Tax=Latimeria chalumnae TaxID=7897 RepID=M3XHQ4_LATCH|nr:PREDICTED: profilin-4 [Latimeria chalumnae]XP_014346273.1 PREDICTED: profilin-4 [Latimeria chalumnae]XP_014346274.1 PREDICTED: profilin-4 [Latimeria chalumnae]XP_014346275.1 PREDICTED: profilin-4 [Latimeria chalumnae]|eukprot:XP_006000096.1 PREDICTED: profilin-4 [Latimeria chalumnae]